MKEEKITNACKSVFNVANINAGGGFCLSVGAGSGLGAGLFAGATVIGTWNKYRSLRDGETVIEDDDRRSFVQRHVQDPSFTAKVLMAAAACNTLKAAYDIFADGPEMRAANICKTLCWAFGVAGDDALRKLDHVNFQNIITHARAARSKLRVSLTVACTNPTVFYSTSCAFLAGKMLLEGHPSPPQAGFGLAVAGLCAAGVAHTFRQTWRAVQGKLAPDKINDGVLNGLTAIASLGQAALASFTGNYWVSAAAGLFTASAAKALYETRSALKKKSHPVP